MPLIDGPDGELLVEVSKLTQDVGRRIGSPKNDLADLKDLEIALKRIAKTLRIIQHTVAIRHAS